MIEAVAANRVVRTIDAIAIDLAGHDVRKITVPDVVGALGQSDAFEFAPAETVEQAKLDLLPVGGKQREIRAAPIPGRAEMEWRALENAHLQLRDQNKPGQWRKRQGELTAALGGDRGDDPGIAHVAAAINARIAVEHLAPGAADRNLDTVVAAHAGSEIHHDDADRMRRAPAAQPSEHALLGVVGNEPFESCRLAVEFVQGRRCAVEMVEIAHQALNAG